MHHLRFRQVHLDFHTSGLIPGIGAKFNKRQFQEALKVGHVDSITIFSKCHHGFSYHPTKVGQMHPHLKIDLLARQIDACREINVRCPIYLSAGLDELAAFANPTWVVKKKDGVTWKPLEVEWFVRILRFNSPYLNYLCEQIEEVCQRWPDNDGIFLDIIGTQRDYSDDALKEMKKLGFNPEDDNDVQSYAEQVLYRYFKATTAAAQSVRKDNPVFHNSGHISLGARKALGYNTHLELESLPTGGWGYDHFPMSARYAITQKWDFMGMTGKFHNTWGEFGGFKRAAALKYECGAMIAYGAKCSVGDQLHPDGEMNLDTYRLIGAAYAEVERKEPWCDDVKPVARIALVSCEINQDRWRGGQAASAVADEGAGRMLLELHQPFVVLDTHADWSGFDLVVLPDTFVMNAANVAKAKKLLARGGRIIAAGSALLDEKHGKFAIDPGATLLGRSTGEVDYLLATALTPNVEVKSPIVIQGGAFEIKPTRAKVLAGRRESYFNRTWEHYCSHQHAPDSPEPATPSAVIGRQIAYFAHDLFTRYRTYGQPLYRDFFEAALRNLLGNKLPVETSLPTAGRIGVMEQVAERRYVAHLLYSPTSVRGKFRDQGIELIEDVIPLRDTRVALRLPKKVKTARLVPDGEALGFTQEDGVVSFTVPEFAAHQMVELGY
ncbi:MAG: alpha-amylase [Verrucomicrobia bacterium]|nr:alpha-amylase [Verrucomicrobiota bacterium]